MIKFIAEQIKPLKKWNESKSKSFFGEIIKTLIFNDVFKLIIFITIAVFFGVLSNFVFNGESMILISWWAGWFPIILIILPYIFSGLILLPIKELIKKIKNKK